MTDILDLLLDANTTPLQGQDQSTKAVVRYSLVCHLEHICNVLVMVTVLLKPSLLASGMYYIPVNISPQVLHFNISIGILVVHLLSLEYYQSNILLQSLDHEITQLKIDSKFLSHFGTFSCKIYYEIHKLKASLTIKYCCCYRLVLI